MSIWVVLLDTDNIWNPCNDESYRVELATSETMRASIFMADYPTLRSYGCRFLAAFHTEQEAREFVEMACMMNEVCDNWKYARNANLEEKDNEKNE